MQHQINGFSPLIIIFVTICVVSSSEVDSNNFLEYKKTSKKLATKGNQAMAQCALRGNSTNLQSRIGNQMYFLIIVNLNFEQILESTPLK